MPDRVSANSGLAQAIGYTLTRWQALDGASRSTTTPLNARGVALSRKNYLFQAPTPAAIAPLRSTSLGARGAT